MAAQLFPYFCFCIKSNVLIFLLRNGDLLVLSWARFLAFERNDAPCRTSATERSRRRVPWRALSPSQPGRQVQANWASVGRGRSETVRVHRDAELELGRLCRILRHRVGRDADRPRRAALIGGAIICAASHLRYPGLEPLFPSKTLRRLWTMLAHVRRTPFKASRLATSLRVSLPSVARYIDSLADLLLFWRLLPFHANLGKRLVKAPKI